MQLAIDKSRPDHILLFCLCGKELHKCSCNEMDFISKLACLTSSHINAVLLNSSFLCDNMYTKYSLAVENMSKKILAIASLTNNEIFSY